MKVRVTTELSAKVAPVTQTKAESQTMNSITLKSTILALNGKELTKYGVVYSKSQNFEDSKYAEGVLSDDGKSFTTTLTGLEQSTKYFYKVVAANENLEGESTVSSTFTSSPAAEKTYFELKLHKYLTNKDKVNTVKVDFGKKIGDALDGTYMEKKGYTFRGWYLDSAFTKAYDPEYTQDTYGEIELFAKWEEGTSSTTSTTKVTTPETTTTTSTVETAGAESTNSTSTQETETSTTEKPYESKGCKSTVGIGASFAMIVAIGTGLALGKKKTK